MGKKLKFEELPSWAQYAIGKTPENGTLQINRNGDSLLVRSGQATYNGRMVGRPGEEVDSGTDGAAEETLNFFRLPLWAWLPVLFNTRYSSGNWAMFGHCLSISGGHAMYDGKQIRYF